MTPTSLTAIPIRCRCGTLTGRLAEPRHASRAVCYCKDCQAYARFLEASADILDGGGGTDIVAARPDRLAFDAGVDRLQCMSLSPRGLLRWYAGCCRTAIGNTPRDPRLSYVGLVRACIALPEADVAAAFGGTPARVNTTSALRPVARTPLRTLLGGLSIARNLLGARLGGGWRANPLFRGDAGDPIVSPHVLSLAERQALGSAPEGGGR